MSPPFLIIIVVIPTPLFSSHPPKQLSHTSLFVLSGHLTTTSPDARFNSHEKTPHSFEYRPVLFRKKAPVLHC